MTLHRRKNRRGPDEGGVADLQSPPTDDCQTGQRDETTTTSSSAGSSPTSASPPPPTTTTIVAKEDGAAGSSSSEQSFHVARFVILRLVGFVYLVAFVGAYYQNVGLMGVHGLAPARRRVDALRTDFEKTPFRGFLSHPSLHWLMFPPLEDWHLDATAIVGSALSLAVVLGLDSWSVMVALWMLDFTIVTLAEGNSFYAYGWESQLLETGFLSIWLCDPPISSSSSSSSPPPPSLPVLWLFRWLCARISVGAGLIKLRGGECWRRKTCLYYHFETQPIPR